MSASSKDLKIEIKTSESLMNLEEYNSRIHEDNSTVRMYLSTNPKKKFFYDGWVSSLIATAASSQRRFILTEWWDQANDENITNRLSGSLIGVTSACLAPEIENTKHQKLNVNIDEIIKTVAVKNQGLINNDSFGHTFSFCSFDSKDKNKYYPRPIALSTSNSLDFIDKFLQIKRDRIDKAFRIEHTHQTTLFDPISIFQREKVFAAMIYELFQNTLEHGCKDENDELIEGVRSFSIKRHIAGSAEELIGQAEGFSELESYLSKIAKIRSNKNLIFYEICIIDNGIGIINRFLASGKIDYAKSQEFEKLENYKKINFIIEKSLSSKRTEGSGLGIKSVLNNMRLLNGFVSLRTNDVWAYFDSFDLSQKISPRFFSVSAAKQIVSTRGTCYNILIPVSVT